MSQFTTLLWQVNLSAEMLFILHARLCVQVADTAVRRRILSDILSRVFAEDVLQEAMRTPSRSPPSLLATYAVFVRLSEGGPVHLTENSMKKLFDLMVTMVKYQLCSLQYPGDVLAWTYTHLDHVAQLFASAVDGTAPAQPVGAVTEVLQRVTACVDTARDQLGIGQLAQLRTALLNNVLSHHIKVSVLVEQGCQRRDWGAFIVPLQPYLMPLPDCMTPGLVQYLDGATVVREERLPHPYAAFSPWTQNAQGGVEAQSQPRPHTTCAMTTAGRNMFLAHKDIFATQERELPLSTAHGHSPTTATHDSVSWRSNDTTSPTLLGPSLRPSATEIEAYDGAMERFATLVRPTAATPGVAAGSRFTLDILLDVTAPQPGETTSRAAGAAMPGTKAAAPSAPGPTATEVQERAPAHLATAQSRHNRELMQLRAQLDDAAQQRVAGQSAEGDSLLDMMDAL